MLIMLESTSDQVSEATTKNCFRKAGISNEAQDNAIKDNDDPFAEQLKRPNLVPEDVDVLCYFI